MPVSTESHLLHRVSGLAAAALIMCAASPLCAQERSARTEYWQQRASLFEILPVSENSIVFLGNSITDGGEFAELLGIPEAINRGINGDVIDGIEERLEAVTSGHPRRIFLLIGINDISHGKSAKAIGAEYRKLVKRILQESPATDLILQSVMPVDTSYGRYRNLAGREGVIGPLNSIIADIAREFGLKYIDLWPALATDRGTLKPEMTFDGLHLNGTGYKAWMDVIRPYAVTDTE